MISLSIRKPIAIIMVILALIVFGIVGFINLPVDLTPNVELPFVTVQALYIGAGPEELETSVIKPIEEQMTTVSGIKNITSFCSEGVGFSFLEFNLGVDADLASIDVKDKIDAILYKLPKDLKKPVISKFDMNAQPIIYLALTGSQSPDVLRRLADKGVKESLVRINGVASIDITGGLEREIQVNLYKEKIEALNLSYMQIVSMVGAQSANIPGGHLSGSLKEYTIRVQGEFSSINDIANIMIPVAGKAAGGGGQGGGGTPPPAVLYIPLSRIAEIEDTYKEVRQKAYFGGKNSVGLAIQKRPDANTVQVADDIFKALDEIRGNMPEGVSVEIAVDRSKMVRDSVNDMYTNVLIGIVLTSVMLLFFLGDWRITIIAAITIPVSVIITFMGMDAFGFSLNIMSLLALAISVGTLVTNSIIVLENIARHRDEGLSVIDASVKGTSEVAIAVIASALTNIAVFVPIANMEGITGQFFKQLGITIVLATVASLFLSFTLVPLLSSKILKAKSTNGDSDSGNIFIRLLKTGQNFLQTILAAARSVYLVILDWCLNYRKTTGLLVVILFFGTLIGFGSQLGSEFFPAGDYGIINIKVEMPSGTSLEETDKTLGKIEGKLNSISAINTVYSALGGSGQTQGVNYASLSVRLKEPEDRTVTTKEVVAAIRPMLTDLPDANITIKEGSAMGGGNQSEGDISCEVTGDDMNEILRIQDSVISLAAAVPGLVDIKSSWKSAKPEMKFIPDRMRLDEYGISVAMLGMNVRYALSGNEDAVFRENNDEYRIRIQLAENDRNSIDAIENLPIPTQRGIVPLKALCKVSYEGGAANINRKNRQRLVTISANVSEGSVGKKAAELQQLTGSIPLKAGYKIGFGGQQEMMKDTFGSLIQAMVLAILLTYIALAAILESLRMPIYIMVTIPLGLIGVILALFLTGKNLSMISMMSMVMLIGVVVNNAILIIEYAMELIKGGMEPRKAVHEACNIKFNAVIMMNLAIVLSSLPQAFQTNSIQAPFAITVIGGIAVSTILTMLFIPSLYLSTQKVKPLNEKL
ncbi:MAG: efflux RND transporter permease subunit [Fibrobacteres bacterium]|nr:efflux RND transporter permease subunit [Fibrobacterota bacterium]